MGGPVYRQDRSTVGYFLTTFPFLPSVVFVVGDDDWAGADPLDRMHAFNQSLRYDQRMHTADIRGSIAYAKALTRVGILTAEEERKMVDGLQAVEREWESGQVDPLSLSPGFSNSLGLGSSSHLHPTTKTFILPTNDG